MQVITGRRKTYNIYQSQIEQSLYSAKTYRDSRSLGPEDMQGPGDTGTLIYVSNHIILETEYCGQMANLYDHGHTQAGFTGTRARLGKRVIRDSALPGGFYPPSELRVRNGFSRHPSTARDGGREGGGVTYFLMTNDVECFSFEHNWTSQVCRNRYHKTIERMFSTNSVALIVGYFDFASE